MSQFDEAVQLRYGNHPMLFEDRARVGRILIWQARGEELSDLNIPEIVDRVFAMTEDEVRAFLEMHALDLTVNG